LFDGFSFHALLVVLFLYHYYPMKCPSNHLPPQVARMSVRWHCVMAPFVEPTIRCVSYAGLLSISITQASPSVPYVRTCPNTDPNVCSFVGLFSRTFGVDRFKLLYDVHSPCVLGCDLIGVPDMYVYPCKILECILPCCCGSHVVGTCEVTNSASGSFSVNREGDACRE